MKFSYYHYLSFKKRFKFSVFAGICFLFVLTAADPIFAQDGEQGADAKIVVNVPAFKLLFYQGNRLIKTYPITIGSLDYSSPYGVERKAVQIVWNPSWTPPASDWARNERPAAPGAANNPLGKLKIRMEDFPFLIHGGGDRSLNRAVSHGCVRLRNADALELARMIVDICKLPVTNKDISRFITNRYREHSVPINGTVIVEFRYDTITVEDGRVFIYPDIYNEGTNTVENLTYVLYKAGINYNRLSPQQQDNLTRALEKSGKKNAKLQDFVLSQFAKTNHEADQGQED
jgi:hypothetical protein